MAADKPQVLLVDDNEATCTLVTALLQREFSVQVATDGLEALEKIKTQNFAAILLDLRMPVLDGFEVLEALKDHPEMLKRVVILTAAVASRDIDRVKKYPICGVIAKPFDVEALFAAVKSCASGAGSTLGNMLSSGVILLLAEMLQRKWL